MALQKQTLREAALAPAPAGQPKKVARSLLSGTERKRHGWRQGMQTWVSGLGLSSVPLQSPSGSSTSTLPSPPANNQQGSFMGNYPPRTSENRQFRSPQPTTTAATRDSYHDNHAGRGRSRSMTRPVDSNGARAGDYGSSYQERSMVVYKDLPPEPGTAAPNDTSASTTDVALADQLAAAKDEIRRLNGINARLREKVTDTAASRTEADPLTTFRVPENVIVSGFRALAYRIHNFVANYYKDESAKDFQAWAELNHSIMSAIHPDFIKMAVNKATSTWLVEAVIWHLLMTQVFSRFGPGEGRGMLWAGRYSTRLRLCKLTYLLSSSIEANNPERQRAFHHWRALTTSLVTTGDSQQTDYHDAVMEIADMLEDLLAPFSSTHKGDAVIKGLETIANEAVELDQTICKQQICYRLRYPPQMFNGEAESAEVVGVPAAGKAGAERKVAGGSVVPYLFVITPLLERSGGRRGEGYGSSECVILEPALVYVGSHSKQLTLMQ